MADPENLSVGTVTVPCPECGVPATVQITGEMARINDQFFVQLRAEDMDGCEHVRKDAFPLG